jgi:hypothetical protein
MMDQAAQPLAFPLNATVESIQKRGAAYLAQGGDEKQTLSQRVDVPRSHYAAKRADDHGGSAFPVDRGRKMIRHTKEDCMLSILADCIRSSRCALVGGVLLSVSACSGAPTASNHETSREEIGQVASALTGSLMGSYTDWSGRVSIRVYWCDWVGPSEVPSATCTIPDADYALVGGGAEICASYPGALNLCSGSQLTGSPGALLTGSYPLDAATWKASSKDHILVYSHYLRAYAIGMKLTGVSNLRSLINLHEVAGAPDSACSTASGFLVGGGAYATYSGNGSMLTHSSPVPSLNCWRAECTDHIFAPDFSGVVHAIAIGIPQCPAGFVGGCLQNGLFTWNTADGTGYLFSQSFASGGWAASSIGGQAHWDDGQAPRWLVDLRPGWYNAGGAQAVWTKDHDYVAWGWTEADALVVASF